MTFGVIVIAAVFGGFAVGRISATFARRMDAIDHATDRAGTQERVAALELELGIRQMTDAEVVAQERLGPNVAITDELREHALTNWQRGRERASQFPRPAMQEIGRRP